VASIRELLKHRVSHRESVASWNDNRGSLHLDSVGLATITEIADEIGSSSRLKNAPRNFLRRAIAISTLEAGFAPEDAVIEIERLLTEDYGKHIAYVPFWGLHLGEGVRLSFGDYELKQIGDDGFENEILKPFLEMRSELAPEIVESDVRSLKQTLQHVPNVPVLVFRYEGLVAAAAETVRPIAERVADMLQFLIAPVVDRRTIHIIDHRGVYFGRFSTIMPVVSFDPDTTKMQRLARPNIRENPWGPKLPKDVVDDFLKSDTLGILNAIPLEPSKGESVRNKVVRAIRSFADGERAISGRQAIISYVGACEVFFGHREHAERYTCMGMALVLGNTEESHKLTRKIYEQRSLAAHAAIEPALVGPARRIAYQTIRYMLEHAKTLSSKDKIRAWIEAALPKKR